MSGTSIKISILSIAKARSGNIFNRVGARHCQIARLGSSDQLLFLGANHLMTPISSKAFGLINGKEILMLISYKYYPKERKIYLQRVASKLGFVVSGGLEKLLAHITSVQPADYIESHVDLRYHDGKGFEAIGFERVSVAQSWQWTDGKQCYNRLACRANMDERKLPEKQHARELGWWRLYDIGQAKYTKKVTKR